MACEYRSECNADVLGHFGLCSMYVRTRTVVFTPRNDTAVCCLLPVLFGVCWPWSMLSGAWPVGVPNVLMLVRVVMTGTWGVVRYTLVLCMADFCGSSVA